MDSLVIRTQAPAKVNLTLQVLGRRANGYHDIRSVAMFADIGDMLEVHASDRLSLTVDGLFADAAGAGEGNLVLKAARLLQEATGRMYGAQIHLTKHIPVGAGLGGGSADAAAVLQALNRLWDCGLSPEALAALAPQLGADVAMCLVARPLLAEGIGAHISLLPEGLPTLHAVLVHPCVPLLTAEVYQALVVPDRPTPPLAMPTTPLAATDFIRWLATMENDLEVAARTVSPQVAELLAALAEDAPPLVRMTGSGACCYALYLTAEEAEAKAIKIAARHPHWWVRATRLAA